jgi:16S rRNA (uracil1498-N3)-methyltransferase
MNLFYTPKINSEIYILDQEESRHCIKVLRLKTGDEIFLTDGKGNLFKCKLIEDNPKKCTVRVIDIQKEYKKPDVKIHMAVAPTKNISRFEWFLEKATEIGVDEITPIISEHSERKIIKPERLTKVITAALKQSLKAYHPILNEVQNFKKFINIDFAGEKYVGFCEDNPKLLKTVYPKGKDVLILIGPEGDFSKKEIQIAKEKGFIPISLGESRLRTETAAVVACHSINFINE